MEKQSLILGPSKTNKGYTVFKNTDEKLVQQIKAMNKPSDTWREFNHKGLCKVVQELNSKQRLCIDEAGDFFIKKTSEFAETSKENLLAEINKKFDVTKYLNTLNLCTENGNKIKFTLNKGGFFGDSYNALGRVMSDEIGVHMDTFRGVTVSYGDVGGTGMFCYFNEDGNVENRDYNYDLKRYFGNQPNTRQKLVDEVVALIPDIEYELYGNKWFAKDFVLVLQDSDGENHKEVGGRNRGAIAFEVTKMPKGSGDNFGDRFTGKTKKPKKTTPTTRESLLSIILPKINEIPVIDGDKVDLSKYFKTDNIEFEKSEKRVQKTKIKESKYSEIFDFTEDEDVLKDKKLMKCLSNIENNIDVGKSFDFIQSSIEGLLSDCDLPSFSFDKGEAQEDHSDFIGLVKMPHGCNFKFKVEEGDACEITWAHSIYDTDVVEFELID